MYKTFEVVRSLTGDREIRVFENGRRTADIILDSDEVEGAVKILEALGYQLLYRDY